MLKEYRICLPMTVEEYKIGQLYMRARHSYEQTTGRDGIEVIKNFPCTDPVYGLGQFTEKRLSISDRLPEWLSSYIPRFFYITEKFWNYYPYTYSEFTCSLVPRLSVKVRSLFQNNNGTSYNCLCLGKKELRQRMVDYIDILSDLVENTQYTDETDLSVFKSTKTSRGPLREGWRDTAEIIMCCYKLVEVSFPIFGLQARVENFVQWSMYDEMVVSHRLAFAWIDEWYDMTLEDVRLYESGLYRHTNSTIHSGQQSESVEGIVTTPNTVTAT
ncbi:hypothetical protein Pmani_037200 [Petrolisthes manimaculis]|uniref:Phosphatidylinositol transfer protein N-terminal domain-containing protein n=1 Tax=Petrolisthes manimaculis TaxID=1843537 RepID=A0AAE1NI75_9EUCA|nr:hypothetical protein Pmani_037200 [Petrolisthes manimaculis]